MFLSMINKLIYYFIIQNKLKDSTNHYRLIEMFIKIERKFNSIILTEFITKTTELNRQITNRSTNINQKYRLNTQQHIQNDK